MKKDGYNEKSVRIRTPAGFKLTVAVYLSTNSQSTGGPLPTPTTALSPAISGAPSVAPSAAPVAKAEVVILETPTGFLRVRSNASVNAPEIARVNPGERIELVEESNGWYLIRLSDGMQGWISAQYAQKQ